MHKVSCITSGGRQRTDCVCNACNPAHICTHFARRGRASKLELRYLIINQSLEHPAPMKQILVSREAECL